MERLLYEKSTIILYIGSMPRGAMVLLSRRVRFMNRLDELFADLPAQLDVHQVAQVLGFTKQGVYGLIRQGSIPAYKIGGTWLILRDELKDTLAAGSNLAGASVEGEDVDEHDEHGEE